jgi:hypothetical protein
MFERLHCSRGSVLAFGTPSSRGSNPAEAVEFFREKKKILSTPSFGGEIKAVLSHVADLWHVKEP